MVKNPIYIKGRPDKFGLFLKKMRTLRVAQIKSTNPIAPIDIFQPRRTVKAIRLNRPKRNTSPPGNLISNSRQTAMAMAQQRGLMNRAKSDPPRNSWVT